MLRVLLLLAVVAAAVPAGTARASLPDMPTVTTLAGDGRPGIVDGPGVRARFEGPQGIAYDARGDLYVADTPAQRIRRVDPRGNVTTIAGGGPAALFGAGVPGGYRNGPALQARFDDPTDVAVAPDGAVYVADSLNHCIRVIRNGTVTTFVGAPNRVGGTDGVRAVASFTMPRSLAFGARGTLYVADPPNGVRAVAPNGTVTTIHDPNFQGAWAVATYHSASVDQLIVASPTLISLYDLRSGKNAGGMFTTNDAKSWPREGRAFVGPAAAVAPLSATQLVYADDLFSTVRLVQFRPPEPWQFTRALGAPPLLNAGARGGGFRDGPGGQALYDQPMGVAVAPDGSIAVADTGNRRIRLLSPFDRRTYETDGARLPNAPDPKEFRVALVGNSLIWTGEPWHRSIGGIVEDRLCAQRPAATPCNVKVYPLRVSGESSAAAASYMQSYLTDGLVNAVVFLVSTPGQLDATTVDPAFAGSLTPMLAGLDTKMAASHTDLLAVLMPGAYEMPNETSYLKLTPTIGPRDPAQVAREYAAELSAVQASHAPYLDLWPLFFGNDDQATFHPLFRVWDHHLTDFGNALVGKAIAQRLIPLFAEAHARR